jgi:quinol monooxygenase YgiN
MSESEYALQARSQAKPEKTEDIAEFLESALDAAEAEKGTTWFAPRLDETTSGTFDTSPTGTPGRHIWTARWRPN